MYKVVETDKEIMWNSPVKPLVTLADEHGGRAQIVQDDHCLILLLRKLYDPSRYAPTCWWFSEAVEAVKSLDIELN